MKLLNLMALIFTSLMLPSYHKVGNTLVLRKVEFVLEAIYPFPLSYQ